jgi:hypothetical protein
LDSWDEDERANSDSAGERNDEARVSDGKSQQVRDQKHRATYVRMDSAPWVGAAQARLLCNTTFFLFNLAKVAKSLSYYAAQRTLDRNM